ncbi:MAG: pyridoxamine 5'-phosphate oxidase family protein [Ginsengibacter sp.]
MIGKLSKQEIEELLEDNVFGHLGCNDGCDSYVYPSNYLYDGKHIICRSQDGFKNQVMRQHQRVCFQVELVNDAQNWKSVMVQGAYEEIRDEVKLEKFNRAFNDRRLFLKMSKTIKAIQRSTTDVADQSKIGASIIFRILIDEKNGRFEKD